MMKRLIGLLVVVLGVSALGGCFLLGPPVIDFAGRALPVDDDGHFKDDIVYQVGTSTYAFTPEGTHEWTTESYEGTGEDWDGDGTTGEGWVITYGERYNYTVDTDNLTLMRDYTHYYDGTANTWTSDASEWITTFNAYFGESKFSYEIMVADPDADNTFVRTSVEAYGGWDYNSVETGVFDPDAMTWSRTFHSDDYDDTGAMADGYENEGNGTFTMLPEGVKFRRGNTITIRTVQENYRYRNWYTATGWDPWTDLNDDSISTMVITHMGDFLMMEGESSYRSVVGRMAE